MTIQMIFQLILVILGAVMTIVVIPLIKKKVSSEDLSRVMTIVDAAVKAAEQIYAKPGQGSLKKKYVIQQLKAIGIEMEAYELDLLIEASVLELNRWKDELESQSIAIGGTE